MPTTRPWGASSAACRMERPGPYPISRTWSPGWTSSNWTVQALRRRLLSRRAITTPASAPRAPEGWPNWLTTRLRRLRLLMKCSDRLPDRGAQRGERSAGAGELLGVDLGGQVEPREEAPLTVGDPPDHPGAVGGERDQRGAPGCRVALCRHQAPGLQGVDQAGSEVPATAEVAAASEISAPAAEVAAAAEVAPAVAPVAAVPAAHAGAHRDAPAAEAAEHVADEQAGQEATGTTAEVSAVPGPVPGGRLVEGHLAVVHQHLPALRLDPAAHLVRAGGAGRDLAGRAAGRRPGDVLDRRTVPRVEEAGRPALGQRLALEQRLRRGHGETALLQGGADLRHVLGPARPVEPVGRLLVAVDCGGVVAHGVRAGAGHLRVDVERPDVVAERQQVFLGDRFHLGELPLGAASPPWAAAALTRSTKSSRSACPPFPRLASSASLASRGVTPRGSTPVLSPLNCLPTTTAYTPGRSSAVAICSLTPAMLPPPSSRAALGRTAT